MPNRTYDLIIYGATGFVGRILCHYLAEHLSSTPHIKWALAGRSQNKLECLQKELETQTAPPPILVADSSDSDALQGLCRSTRAIVSTVGPYAAFGELLVAACAETGTDYCDITGEAYWIKRMIDRYQASAEQSGARLVNCCGFDSIPSDLGVLFLQTHAHERFKSYLSSVSLRVSSVRGGASGGTIASVIEAIKAAKSDPDLRRQMLDPYQLCPQTNLYKVPQLSLKGAGYDSVFNAWMAPFVMEAINTRVVLRSSVIGDLNYGQDFTYDEAVLTGHGLRGRLAAIGVSLGIGAMLISFYFNPLRSVLNRWVLPSPGEGPSPEAQLRGNFDLRLYGTNEMGAWLGARVNGDRDPGYGSTAKMLAQSALCLLETPHQTTSGGFWTPATAMGDALIDRLQRHAGITFDIEESPQNIGK